MIGTFDGPGLALYGGSDSRIDAAENAAALRRLAAKPGLQIEISAGADPPLSTRSDRRPANYARNRLTLAPELPARIVTFLKRASG